MASRPTRQRLDPNRLERKCETQKVGYRTRAAALTAAERMMDAGRVQPGCHITPYLCRSCGEYHNANKVIVPLTRSGIPKAEVKP